MALRNEARGMYQARTDLRKGILNVVEFTVNGAAAPVIDFDDGKVLDSTASNGGITRTGAGTFLITLRHGYVAIAPAGAPNIDGITDSAARVSAVVVGTGATNTIEVETIVGGVVADTAGAQKVSVAYIGTGSKVL